MFSTISFPFSAKLAVSKRTFSLRLDSIYVTSRLAFGLFVSVPCTVHWTRKYFFPIKNNFKIELITLFTHLKIILLQCFQFSIFNNKQYLNRPLVWVWLQIKKLVYFIIQLNFATIHGSYCTISSNFYIYLQYFQ